MHRYVEGWHRNQSFLLPESVDDYVGEDNPVRVVDAFVDELDLAELGFGRATPADTRPPRLPPGHAAEALSLRLPEPNKHRRDGGVRWFQVMGYRGPAP